MKLFVNEQVASMCQRAYFSYKKVETQNQVTELEELCKSKKLGKIDKDNSEETMARRDANIKEIEC